MIRDRIRGAFTRTVFVQRGRRKKLERVKVPPNERIVWMVIFSIASLGFLTALEIVYVIFLGSWNSEVFAAISWLIGAITGIFVGAKA